MAKCSEIIALARKQVGTRECPAGSNNVRYNTWYYGREVSGKGFPWCMTFMQWLADQEGLTVLRTAGCTALANWAKQRGEWVTGGYRPGDWAMFDFDGVMDGETEHVGLVIATTSSVTTIEGNTGSGSDADGGQVQERTRKAGVITGAWRPRYEEEKQMAKQDNTPGEYAKEAVQWAQESGLLKGDTEGNLKLHAPVTREQLMVFLHRFQNM